ncbi:hypothetical protein Rsub_04549 [Raphidocelis subcapitata]|uniref:N-acetyltransferase domain-containing protein n=1 Tax=Raphidocelis subcapitata TaxID=307507 RepID=A0A2V0P5T9_9CHLO|nr:hypothetical protein Rsub_04549 [Raphidocelis subcapitata]|eukprot:GBF92445.1 hypothetical protein Rsub_04549 [Raphidocelis subcapitata]
MRVAPPATLDELRRLDDLAALDAAAFGPAGGSGLLQEFAAQRGRRVVVALGGGDCGSGGGGGSGDDDGDGAPLLGYVLYQPSSLAVQIVRLAVAPAARRRGVGRALIQAAIAAAAAQRRVACATLHVAPSNAPALALYRACGFADDAIVQDYYGRGAHAVRMVLELGDASHGTPQRPPPEPG